MLITRRALAGGVLAASTLKPALADAPVKWIASGAHSYLAPFFAAQTGIFSRQGVDVQMIVSTSPPAMLPAVVGGSVQMGSSTAVQIAMARESGLDVGIFASAAIQWKGHPVTGAIVRADSPIHEAKDFIGRKVVSPGTYGTFYLMFLRYLLNHGIDPKQVTMLEGNFAQMGDMLRSGQADAILAVEPFMFQMLDSGFGRRIEYFEMDTPYTFDSFYICTSAWARANAAVIGKLRAGLAQSMAEMQAQPERTVEVEAASFKLSPDIVRRLGPPVFPTEVKPSDLAIWLEIGHRVGLLQKNEDPAEMIVT